jgi:hypothetical protein
MKTENQKLKAELSELKAANRKREALMENILETHVMTIELRNAYREKWNEFEPK